MSPVDFAALPDAEVADAATSALAWLKIEAAKLYGLVDGGPRINVGRCEEIIAEAEGRFAGARWRTEDVVDERLIEILAELAQEHAHA